MNIGTELMNLKPVTSLQGSLKRISIRWMILGFIISTVGAAMILRVMEEHRVQVMSEAVTRVFRPKILDGDIRDVQSQARSVLSLKNDEQFLIRGKNLEVLYSPDGQDHAVECKNFQKACYFFSKGFVYYLQPVFFNDELRDSVFGYTELKVTSFYNVFTFLSIAGTILSLFLLIIYGITLSQRQMVKTIKTVADEWAEHLKTSLTKPVKRQFIPYKEFASLADVIQSLHSEVGSLTKQTATASRTNAQLSILRGIGHDLRTPFSQLLRFYGVFKARAESQGFRDEELFILMERSMNHLGSLLKQIGETEPKEASLTSSEGIINVALESETYLNDLKAALDLSQPPISIEFKSFKKSVFIRHQKIQYYRLLDNLVKNALDAMEESGGFLRVEIKSAANGILLVVSDNGSGISPNYLDKIFDADFTTKATRGTGLGLANVKKICADFNSDLKVVSQPGVGTQFTILFAESTDTQFSSRSEVAYETSNFVS